MNNLKEISEAAKVSNASIVWIDPSIKPIDISKRYSLLIKWFDVPEIMEVGADWHMDEPKGSKCSYFVFFLFGDEHQIGCTVNTSGLILLGWKDK